MGVYRRLSTAKNHSKDIKCGAFLWCRFLQTPGEKLQREEKKMNFPLAIGENYINKNVSFLPVRVRTQTGLLTFYLCMFLLIANRKESENISHRK